MVNVSKMWSSFDIDDYTKHFECVHSFKMSHAKNNISTAWPIINIDTLCLDFEPHIHFVSPDMQLY